MQPIPEEVVDVPSGDELVQVSDDSNSKIEILAPPGDTHGYESNDKKPLAEEVDVAAAAVVVKA